MTHKHNGKWKPAELGDLIDIFDSIRVPLNSRQRAERQGRFPYYGASGVIDSVDDYLFDGEYVLVAEDGENLNSRKLPVAFMARGQFWVNNHAHIIKGKKGIADDRFLIAWFAQADIKGYITGAAQPKLSQANLKRIALTAPPFPVQRKIAGVLSAYDDLIENNTRRIAILEEMAQAIYREWFVNFRFPGHEKVKLINSPLGKIPEGWKVGVINDVARLLSGFAFKSETFVDDGEYRLVTIRNVHDGRFVEDSDSLLDALPEKMPDHCHLSSGDILLSLTGNIGRTCIVYGSGFLLNQRVAKLSPLNATDKGYVYCLFRSPDTQARLSNIANGVAQQNLSPVQTGQLPHPLPPRSLLDSFAETITPLFWNIVQLYRKTSNLRKTRDLLLPKLITGQLDVEQLDIDAGEPLVEATT